MEVNCTHGLGRNLLKLKNTSNYVPLEFVALGDVINFSSKQRQYAETEAINFAK